MVLLVLVSVHSHAYPVTLSPELHCFPFCFAQIYRPVIVIASTNYQFTSTNYQSLAQIISH